MKKLWIAFGLCLLPLTGQAIDPFKGYNTLNLTVWANHCANTMFPLFLQQGIPPSAAMNMSYKSCACVIDGFRETYETYDEVMALEASTRQLKSKQYALICANESKSEEL